jgi:hypothetical protein
VTWNSFQWGDRRSALRGACRLLGACLLLAVAGCRPQPAPATAVKVRLEFQPDPPRVGTADVVLRLTDTAGAPLAGAEIELEGNMNHAGMKPVFSELKETESGRYTGKLDFTMGGDWFVLVTGNLADGQPLNEKVDVPGVQRP